MKKPGHYLLTALFVLGLAISLMACSGGGGGGASPGETSTSVSGNGSTTVSYQPGSGVRASLSTTGSVTTVTLTFPANAAGQAGVITLSTVSESNLPVPLHSSKLKFAAKFFQANSANVYIYAFTISTDGIITGFNVPLSLSGTVSPTIPAGTTYNLASLQTSTLQPSTWLDVGTVTVVADGTFVQNLPSLALPGILVPGTYLIYQPAPDTSTAVSNLGIALIAYEESAFSTLTHTNSLQVVHLFDANGTPLPTPTISWLLYPDEADLDGEAMTPDGSQGIMVDGGNNLLFFSNVQTGVPIASTNKLDVSAYGSDGDSVAIMPNGDEAVVSLDTPTLLLVVSGILSGNPQTAMTITIPDKRDGLVISNDGTVLLARGRSGLTVISITSMATITGPLGGQVSNSYEQTADLTSVISTTMGGLRIEDGREGMAMSPMDSGRAVIIGTDATVPAIQLITGLAGTPSPSLPVDITGAISVWSVSITPDGTTAVAGTNAGLAMFTGVDTGTLTQVGTLFAPTYTGSFGNKALGLVTTLGITLDGNYVVVCDDTNSALLVIPIIGANGTGATGLGSPVGILNGIAVPFNDQMVIH